MNPHCEKNAHQCAKKAVTTSTTYQDIANRDIVETTYSGDYALPSQVAGKSASAAVMPGKAGATGQLCV
jgi:hypothetical protein